MSHIFKPFRTSQAKQSKKGKPGQENADAESSCAGTSVQDQTMREVEREHERMALERDLAVQKKRHLEETLQAQVELLDCERSRIKLDLQLKAVREKLECLDRQQKNEQKGSEANIEKDGEKCKDIVTDIEEKIEKAILSSSIFIEKNEPALYRDWCNVNSSADAQKLLQKINRKLVALNDLYVQVDALLQSFKSYEEDQPDNLSNENHPLVTTL